MVKILIADDEARMVRLVSDFLKKEGFMVFEARDGKEAIDIFNKEENINLVVLDVMMPIYDGWTVCREIRKTSKDVPIIMLTARSEETDEVFGFDMGADDYITKPFSPLVLVARIKALLRRVSDSKVKTLRNIDSLTIDESSRTVTIDDKRIDLSPKEYELLLYLVENQNIAVSRDQILNAIWGYDYFGDGRTVDTHIKKLRAKIGEKGDYIQTVRGFGYRFEVVV